ncbi:Ribonuclease R [[Mycoplasma] cavipharyngis]|uniref:ribonuclease R n=1 Tax=[Mycoplasma] cavipharyngis TaxID=92757 RepID=UPI003703A2EF
MKFKNKNQNRTNKFSDSRKKSFNQEWSNQNSKFDHHKNKKTKHNYQEDRKHSFHSQSKSTKTNQWSYREANRINYQQNSRFDFNQNKKNYPFNNDDKPIPIHNNDYLEQLLTQSVIQVLKDDQFAMPLFVLINKTIKEMKKTDYHHYIEKGQVLWIINLLEERNIIAKNSRDKYYLDYLEYPEIPNSEGEGTFKCNIRGNFGHIIVKNSDQEPISYYVHKRNFNHAIDGDTVKFIQLDTSSSNKIKQSQDVKILEVLEHQKDHYVGEVKIDLTTGIAAESYYALLDNPKIKTLVKITNPIGIVEGHKVLLKITDFNSVRMVGEIVKILGHKNDVGIDIESIVYDNGIEIDFPHEAIKEVEKIDHDFSRFEQQKCRIDLTDVPFYTIDPSTSKDFDDAIHVQKEVDHYLLRVAIADVCSYVPINSALDHAAENRGTSVYLINAVIPMLPHLLSNDLCSLNPHVKRCAIVCDIKIDFNGKIDFSATKVFPALIKSHKRFSYDQVNEYFRQTTDFNQEAIAVKTSIDVAYELFKKLEIVKKQRGYINFFAIHEPKIIVDENNEPLKIEIYQTYHAQQMIENFMVAANEAVTAYAHLHKIPFIYRVHGLPALKKLEHFSLVAKKLNFKITTKINNQISSGDIAKWIDDNHDHPYNQIIHMMLLRSMDKAIYSNINTYHFGLASQHYTHFTSPIRRYPDMIVHRLFWMYLFDPTNYTDAERNIFKNRLEELCAKCSEQELKATQTERDVNDLKFAQYMQQFIGNEFEAIVLEVNAKGCYVQLSNLIQGFAPIILTKYDFFKFDQVDESLIGQRTQKRLTIGSEVLVKVNKVDLHLRSIDFEIVDILNQPKFYQPLISQDDQENQETAAY